MILYNDINTWITIIYILEEFTIDEGKREDFKKLIQEMTKAVQETELDTTITYQFYLNKDIARPAWFAYEDNTLYLLPV